MASNETSKYKLSVVEGTELKLSLSGSGISQPKTFSIGRSLEMQVQQLSLVIRLLAR